MLLKNDSYSYIIIIIINKNIWTNKKCVLFSVRVLTITQLEQIYYKYNL